MMQKKTKWCNYLQKENYQYHIERVPSELGWMVCELPPNAIKRLKSYIEIVKGEGATNQGSTVLRDVDDWFFKNYLEYMCYDFFKLLVTTSDEPCYHRDMFALKHPFFLESIWVNFQKQLEFVSTHNHDSIFSFNIFMEIPTHWTTQHTNKMDRSAESAGMKSKASDFVFEYVNGYGEHREHPITMSPEVNGKLIFFDSRLYHHVNPFYDCDEDRITISGNILYNTDIRLTQDDLKRKFYGTE